MQPRHFVIPAFLLLCILLGGASLAGYTANLTLQLIALAILVAALLRDPHGLPASAKSLQWLAVGLIGLMALQLVPLPPAIWTMLPGRERIVEGYALLGQPLPWLPWSLAPDETLGALLWLLPALAVLFGMIRLGAFRARQLAWFVVGGTLVAILIGALQFAGGHDSAFYFYRVTNRGLAVGPFANANHMATLLLIAIPFFFALIGDSRCRRHSRSASGIITACVAGLGLVAVGLAINTSLAGIGLAVPVALASLLLLRRSQSGVPLWSIALVGLISVAAVVLMFVLPIGNNLIGDSATSTQSRATSISVTLKAAVDHLPFGSGFGSFASIYRVYEDPTTIISTWMNHAHSDYSEILLEGGIPAALLVIAFLAWWTVRTLVVWGRKDPGDVFARAATIASGAVLVHSVVDYPLRTAAISALLAMCAVLMTGAREAARKRTKEDDDVRHLSA